MHQNVVARIDTDALAGNVEVIRRCCGGAVRICAVVKSNAYGHDARIVGPVLQDAGITWAAVATLEEAIELRSAGFVGRILCFGPVFAAANEAERAERLAAIVAYDLSPTLVDIRGARDLNDTARRADRNVSVHFNVDTGISRLGISPEAAQRLVREVWGLSHLCCAGLYTHFANAESADVAAVGAPLATLLDVDDQLRRAGFRIPIRHAANSAAVLRCPDSHRNMVRPGLLLFGCLPDPALPRPAGLRPVLRVCAPLVLVRRVPAGTSVGYGGTFVTQRSSILGVVPIGYSDGYSRALSNLAIMGLPSGDAPVVGRISMDQCVLDLTDCPGARVGDEVTVIDDRPERPNSLESLARLLGTIPYELACLLGDRVRRVAVGSLADVKNRLTQGMAAAGGDLLQRAATDRRRRPRRPLRGSSNP